MSRGPASVSQPPSSITALMTQRQLESCTRLSSCSQVAQRLIKNPAALVHKSQRDFWKSLAIPLNCLSDWPSQKSRKLSLFGRLRDAAWALVKAGKIELAPSRCLLRTSKCYIKVPLTVIFQHFNPNHNQEVIGAWENPQTPPEMWSTRLYSCNLGYHHLPPLHKLQVSWSSGGHASARCYAAVHSWARLLAWERKGFWQLSELVWRNESSFGWNLLNFSPGEIYSIKK